MNKTDLFQKDMKCYYEDEFALILEGDSFKNLELLNDKSIDCIFADPPYFLSNDGITVSGGKMVSVNKGKWDKGLSPEEKLEYNRTWIRKCKRVLKDTGTIWISGTLHNIFSVGVALEMEGFKILNNVTWKKLNPPPNLACKTFTHSTENIIWAKKDIKAAKHYFNYTYMKELNGGKQMKDVWEGPLTSKKEKTLGKHPTQKPEYLLERIIQASTKEGDIILDPFMGSGTTGVAAKRLNRFFIGMEMEPEYLDLSRKRIENEEINLWHQETLENG